MCITFNFLCIYMHIGTNIYIYNYLINTCKQSNATLTILKHFDWQASSKGKKYLSASTNPACLGVGRADDDWSSLKINKNYI